MKGVSMFRKGQAALAFFIVVITIGLMIGVCIIGAYNHLTSSSIAVTTLWSQVETQYQRRAGLIPNLVNATKGYLAHEQKVLIEVTQARSNYGNASTLNEKIQASAQLDSALARLLVVIEKYPDLKADVTVRALTDELAGTENRVNIARQRFNEGVQEYNIVVRTFPSNLIAQKYNFTEKEFFKSATGTEQVPVVDMNMKGMQI
jgi:LemA protein